MNEYSYQYGRATRELVVSLIVGLPILWISAGEDILSFTSIVSYLLVVAIMYGFQSSYLFNEVLLLGGGKLTIRRRLGRDKVIPLDSIVSFRIEEQSEGIGRSQRKMIIFHRPNTTRINVSDLRDERGFISSLEGRLEGEATIPLDALTAPPKSKLQKQLNRLYR